MNAPEWLLLIETPDGITRSHALTGDELVLGRSTSAGLPIRDPSLSREHARIKRVSEGWVIEDLGSHNGTFLNGRLLEGHAPIRPGDLLCLGGTRIHVQSGSQTKDREKTSGSQDSVFRSAREIVDEALRVPPQTAVGELRRYAEHLRLLNEIHQAYIPERDASVWDAVANAAGSAAAAFAWKAVTTRFPSLQRF